MCVSFELTEINHMLIEIQQHFWPDQRCQFHFTKPSKKSQFVTGKRVSAFRKHHLSITGELLNHQIKEPYDVVAGSYQENQLVNQTLSEASWSKIEYVFSIEKMSNQIYPQVLIELMQ